MILAAWEVEVEAYRQQHRDARDRHGHALVVRNGPGWPRRLTVGLGTGTIRAPRVHDQRVVDGVRQKFTSQILPPLCAAVAEGQCGSARCATCMACPAGISSRPCPCSWGRTRPGLSPAAITRLTATWRTEYGRWQQQSLADRDFIYVWVDGVHFNIRLEEDRLAALVVVGVRPDGTKELLAIEDGDRESMESWLAMLRDVTARGMRALALAIGDGALGFWTEVREVWPEPREQRCWVHQIANVLDKLPTRLQLQAKRAVHDMMYAKSRATCEATMQHVERQALEQQREPRPRRGPRHQGLHHAMLA
jgi:putative transposase